MILNEYVTPLNIKNNAEVSKEDGSKHWYMKGIFLQGEERNRNGRVYPKAIIEEAVQSLQERMKNGETITGELDHPEDLSINSKEISHMIEEIHMEGNYGVGTIKVLHTPIGLIVGNLLEEGVRLGVSSRGQGDLGYGDVVTSYDISTIDIVNQPSGQKCLPTTLYESIFNTQEGKNLYEVENGVYHGDFNAIKYVQDSLRDFINKLN